MTTISREAIAILRDNWRAEAARCAPVRGVPIFQRDPVRSETLRECAAALDALLTLTDV